MNKDLNEVAERQARGKRELNKLMDMAIHDDVYLDIYCIKVLRVVGGWIYWFPSGEACFVPQPKKQNNKDVH